MHYHNGNFVSLLPLLDTPVTHVIVAAIHITSPTDIKLNDGPYDDPKNRPLWAEVRELQRHGVKVLGMLGGAATGSFAKLDGDAAEFETHYALLHGMLAWTVLDGLDLDAEEATSLAGAVRLIDRLKRDFGAGFLITAAPIAPAMWGQQNLSGFEYEALEKALAPHVAWYNVMFYCGWGCAASTHDYDRIIARGWPPSKVVLGLVTNPRNCAGWVGDNKLRSTLIALRRKYPDFGGVMGWEYFNSLTEEDGEGKPWCWARWIGKILRPETIPQSE